MARSLSRQELYDLVWSEPMRGLAPRFEISDVALRKTCVRAFVPVPERGYWAKLKAGKPAIRVKLLPRPPGLSDVVEIGGYGNYYRPISDEDLLGPIPEAPSFPEPLEDMEAVVRKLLGKVKPIRALDSPHTEIRKILRKEEERRLRYLRSNWSWEAPLFDTPFEQRRLRFLNSLFMAIAKNGARPDVRGATARDITVRIHDQNVGLRLDTLENIKRDAPYDRPYPTEPKAPLRLVISATVGSTTERHAWPGATEPGRRLEHRLNLMIVPRHTRQRAPLRLL